MRHKKNTIQREGERDIVFTDSEVQNTETESEIDSGGLYLEVPHTNGTTRGDINFIANAESKIANSKSRKKLIWSLLLVIFLISASLGYVTLKYFELKNEKEDFKPINQNHEEDNSIIMQGGSELDSLQKLLQSKDDELTRNEKENEKYLNAFTELVRRTHILESTNDSENALGFFDTAEHEAFLISIESGDLSMLEIVHEIITEPFCDLQRLMFLRSATNIGSIEIMKYLFQIETTKNMHIYLNLQPIDKEIQLKYNQLMYNTLKYVLVKTVDIGEIDVMKSVLEYYGTYIIAVENTERVRGAFFDYVRRYKSSLLGVATVKAFEGRKFQIVKYLKKYENEIAIPESLRLVVADRGLSGKSADDFLHAGVRNSIRDMTYFELKELVKLDWYEMQRYYVEEMIGDNRDFYLKKAAAENESRVVALFLENKSF